MDNSSSIYKVWRTATRQPTTIAAAAAAFFSTTCPLQVEADGDIWCGVVWSGGGGKERGKRVEGPGRVDQQQQQQFGARSELLFLLLLGPCCCCCCCWRRLRERAREREKRKTEGTRAGWVVDPAGPVLRSNWEMGASFGSSKVGCASDLSGSYKNFVTWAFFLFGFGFFSFLFLFFFFPKKETRQRPTDWLTHRPTDVPPTNPMDGWMNRWMGRMDRWMGWMDEYIDRWMGWMDGWIEGWDG